MSVDVAFDESRLEQFMGSVLTDMGGLASIAMVCVGDELGLYEAMDGAGPVTAAELAVRTAAHPRLVQEWLDQQAASGYVTFNPAIASYELPEEHAMALARRQSPVFVAGGAVVMASMFQDLDKVIAAFRGDGGLAWGDHSPSLFRGTAEFFRPGYQTHLTTEWIPALDGVADRLAAGGRIADVGCGHGVSSIVMAQAYPACTVNAFDYHGPSIESARESAGIAGVGDRVHCQVARADAYPGTYDLICFFDCLHDMGDPVGIARHAKEHLAPGGTVMLVEPFAFDDRAANHANPVARAFYGASTFICTPNSLSQDVGRGLGAQCGEAGMRQVFEEAGFSHFRRAAETPFNLVYEARA